MAINVGSLVGTLSLNLSDFVSGMKRATTIARATSRQVVREFNRIDNAAVVARESSDNLGASFKDLGRIVSGILIAQTFYQSIQAIQQAASAVSEFSQSMEKARVSLTFMLKSVDRADAFINTMKDFAVETDYSTGQVIEMSRRLQAMGFEAESTASVMQVITDQVSLLGGGFDKVDRIAYALGQIKSSAKLAKSEVRQLTEATVPANRYLQEAFDLTDDQIQNIGKLGISGQDAVTAILAGMERDSKGITKILADTVSGAVNAIKDNFLIIASDLTAPIYNVFRQLLLNLRDTLNSIRETLEVSGIGGVLNDLFPPEVANNIRVIFGTIQLLIKAMGNFYQAMQPVIEVLAGTFLQTLAIIGPPIARLILFISQIAKALITTVPAVKALAVALTGLFIVNLLTKAFAVFFGVLKLGTIISFVTVAVKQLAVAIRVLYVALTSNPIVAVVTLIAGALLYLAIQMGLLDKATRKLTNTLSGLAGINPKEILQPIDKKVLDSQDEFNKHWSESVESINGTGNAAEDAGKKIKNKFLASFDEVFQVPEKLDDVNDSFSNLLNPDLFDPDFFKDIFNYEIPDIFDDATLDLSFLDDLLLIPAKMNDSTNKSRRAGKDMKNFFDDFFDGLGAVVTSGVEVIVVNLGKIEGALGDIVRKLRESTETVQQSVVPVTVPLNTLVDVLNKNPEGLTTSLGLLSLQLAGVLTDLQLVNTELAKLVGDKEINVTLAAETVTENTTTIIEQLNLIPKLIPVVATLAIPSFEPLNEALEALEAIPETKRIIVEVVFPTLASINESVDKLFLEAKNILVLKFTEFFTETLPDIFTDFVDWIKEDWKKILIGALIAVAAAAIFVFGGEIVTGIGAALAGIGTAVSAAVSSVGTYLSGTGLAATAGSVGTWVSGTLAALGALIVGMGPILVKFGSKIKKFFGTLFTDVKEVVSDKFSDIYDKAVEKTGDLYDGVSTKLSELSEFVDSVTIDITDFFRKSWETITSDSDSFFGGWLPDISAYLEEAAGFFESLASKAINFIIDMWSGVSNETTNREDDVVESTEKVLGSMESSFGSFTKSVLGIFESLWTGIKNYILGIETSVTDLKDDLSKVEIKPPKLLSGGSIGFDLSDFNQAATGGIVSRDQLIRVGEGDRKEAIVPLERSDAVDTFARAIIDKMPTQQQQATGAPVNVYEIGTLIGDERSIAELERRLNAVRAKERSRVSGGGTYAV